MLPTLLALSSLLIGTSLATTPPLLSVDIASNGSYSLSVGGTEWLRSAPPRLHLNSSWATLTLLNSSTDHTAAITTWRWSISGPNGPAVWETSVSVDQNAAIFSQTFLSDASGTGSGGAVLSEWPSVQASVDSLGCVIGAGMDGGPHTQLFKDPAHANASRPAVFAGANGGNVALFDSELNTLVVSPASEFMSSMMSGGLGVGDLVVGVSGSVTSVPAGHSVQTIMLAGHGVRDTYVSWGDRLMSMHGKVRTMPARSSDPIVTHLGYSLTGCYQYNPCDCGEHAGNCESTGPFAAALNSQCKDFPGDKPKTSRSSCQPCPAQLSPPLQDNATDDNCSTMSDTLLLLDKHIRGQLKLNFSSFLIDSFWYGENINKGVWMWEDVPELVADLFPAGLEAVHRQLLVQRGGNPLSFKAHNGQWSSSPYRNDSRFSSSNYCAEGSCIGQVGEWLPQGPQLWRHLFDNRWGLSEIKQDHMNEQLEMKGCTTTVNVARDWLQGMGDAATELGFHVSYCMTQPRIVMNSVTIPSATHARATPDYFPNLNERNWAIGGSAVFVWGAGLLPYKDTFQTTSYRARNHLSSVRGDPAHHIAPNVPVDVIEEAPLLHALASILSAAPVAFGDCMRAPTNMSILGVLSRQDGTLLKPDVPIRSVDHTWLQKVFGTPGPAAAELWSTTTQIGDQMYGVVFAASHKAPIAPTLSQLHLQDVPSVSWRFNLDQSIEAVPIANGGALSVGAVSQKYGDDMFALHFVSPVLSNGCAVLGEVSKAVPVSPQRTTAIRVVGDGMEVDIVGSAGEAVRFAFMSKEGAVSVSTATIGDGGTATVRSVKHVT